MHNEETSDMEQTIRHRGPQRRVRAGRWAGALVAVGTLSASVVVADTAGAATSTTVSTTKSAKYGTIVVSGKTVYTLKASKTPCTANCLKIWPEVLLPKGTTKAKAGTGVSAAKLGTIKRGGGALQITYAGKPLYWFVGDTAAGQVHGVLTDTWGKWSVVVTAKPTSSTSGTGAGSGGSGGSSAGTGGVSF
jgi:predicted lipoprotein with Yx(FWY)xxD motif